MNGFTAPNERQLDRFTAQARDIIGALAVIIVGALCIGFAYWSARPMLDGAMTELASASVGAVETYAALVFIWLLPMGVACLLFLVFATILSGPGNLRADD